MTDGIVEVAAASPSERADKRARATTGGSGPSTRVRILGWYVGLLVVALVVGLLLQRTVLRSELNREINEQLRQEVDELYQLSSGRDPQTGSPFGGDVAAIFTTFLRRNIPVENEALFALIDGKPFSSTVTPLQLFDVPGVMHEWATVTSPTQREVDTDAGKVRYLAVPVTPEGARGTFVVAFFIDSEYAEIDSAVQTAGVVFGTVLGFASVVAWFALGRVLRPVRLLTETANSISDSNWTERIPVSGTDEIADLARTFNEMVDRLEESFTTQRRFLDDAGHELRTPITVVRGHLELMGDTPGEKEEVKRIVLDELDRMSRIVDDLLLLARSEQPDFLATQPLDVSELTDEIATKSSALSPDREWIVEERAFVVISGDRHRLTQALMNLTRNAFENCPEPAPIAIGSRSDGDYVRFWVRDSGPGIPLSEQERIFERFARGNGGHLRTDGAGLGLAIVKAIVESHGGAVEITSAPERGSTFTLVLPLSGPEDVP